MSSLYKRGSIWWVKSYRNGKMVRTSLKTTDKAEARRLMKALVDRVPSTLSGTKDVPSVTWDTAAQDLLSYYRAYGTRDVIEAGYKVKTLTEYFSGTPLEAIDAQAITAYVVKRKAQGMSNATCNIELSTLRKALRLAMEHGKLGQVPPVRTLKPGPPRAGFLERCQIGAICQGLDADLRVAVLIGFTFGWRIDSEVLTLSRSQVNLETGTLTLAPGTTKNDDGRLVYLTPELKVMIGEQLARVRTLEKELNRVVPWLFPLLTRQRKGQRRVTMDRAWLRACQASGLEGTLKHDLRRSAVRNLINAGVPTRTAMLITGHRSLSVFNRYHIVSPGDLREATRRLSALSDHTRHNLGTGGD
jgi:integrase